MISRRKVLEGGAIAALVASVPLIQIRQARAQAVSTFDYYISPNGDDNNSGTLASPWSITALNSKQSTYGGKRIGIIGDKGLIQFGTVGGVRHTLYSLYQSAPHSSQVLVLNGGPSASQPTYLASCNSSGAYSARLAIIDASDPATGNKPTVEATLIAQNTYQGLGPVDNWGNVTVDGLTIRNFTFAALMFYGSQGTATQINNVIIKNCEIYNGQNVISNNNPGAIWFDGANGALVTNNSIHDLQTDSGGTTYPLALLGYIQFNSLAMKVTNCTFYNCVAVSQKDSWQQLEVSYCYLGFGTFGSGYNGGALLTATVHNYLTQTGLTNNFHHNICIGPVDLDGESTGQQNRGQVNIYNNTFYGPVVSGPHKMDALYCNLGNSGGRWSFYNNLVYSPYGYDGASSSNKPGSIYITAINANSSWFSQCDYNAYGAGMTFGYGWNAGQYALPISNWKGYGLDAHSITLSSNPFTGTPSESNPTSFAISGPATTAGVGGAVCGAVDGSGPIGCNFVGSPALIPKAPSLTVS
jgi:hypothetical protein